MFSKLNSCPEPVKQYVISTMFYKFQTLGFMYVNVLCSFHVSRPDQFSCKLSGFAFFQYPEI
jgi:hypothetical protein